MFLDPLLCKIDKLFLAIGDQLWIKYLFLYMSMNIELGLDLFEDRRMLLPRSL